MLCPKVDSIEVIYVLCFLNIKASYDDKNKAMKTSAKKLTKKKGQVVVEYVLLVVVSAGLFLTVFLYARRSIFQIWVCGMSPRIQSPTPCQSAEDCFNKIDQVAGLGGSNDKISSQRQLCSQIKPSF